MSTALPDQTGSSSITLSLPRDVGAEMQKTAAALGMKPESYLMILHDINSGKVARSFLREAREVFTNDREVLKELAK